MMALEMAWVSPLSQGWMTIWRASGVEMAAQSLMRIIVP